GGLGRDDLAVGEVPDRLRLLPVLQEVRVAVAMLDDVHTEIEDVGQLDVESRGLAVVLDDERVLVVDRILEGVASTRSGREHPRDYEPESHCQCMPHCSSSLSMNSTTTC